jgi:hypothetical protein
MSTVLLIVGCVQLAACWAWVLLAARAKATAAPEIPAESPRDQLLSTVLRERFVVTLATGETFDGLLLDVDDRTLLLGQASTITANGTHPVDGQLGLHRGAVAYMQRPRDTA